MPQRSHCPVCSALVEATPEGREGICNRCLVRAAMLRPGVTDDEIEGIELLGRLGEGGMAMVYLGEQAFPVRREVAVKIIKLGMDTDEVIARFNNERQTLAIMEHPNIASVFSAGSTTKGRPYFVMEYVEGDPIDRWAAGRKLHLRTRLELFTKICRAVQHAHQKGILHRDLKPSNILVREVAGVAEPKIIDFGIAKALPEFRGLLANQTLNTRAQYVLGTPLYMSPEQAAGRRDLDVRTDVYSLGVILYELLTGQSPHEEARNRDAEETLKAVREADPISPSGRCSRNGDWIMAKSLEGDLDWIALKALEKERDRRYPSAEALALEVERHLNHEPVQARPPSTLYRMTKFARRYRVPLVAAGAVLVALMGGLTASLWQARKVRGERDRTARIVDVLKNMLSDVDPGTAGRQLKMVEFLATAERRAETELTNEPAVLQEVRRTLASAFAGIGADAESEAVSRRLIQRHRDAGTEQTPDGIYDFSQLGTVLGRQRRREESEAILRQTMALAKACGAPCEKFLPGILRDLGALMAGLGKNSEAEVVLQEAGKVAQKIFGGDNGVTAGTYGAIAQNLFNIGDFETQVVWLRKAIEMKERIKEFDAELAIFYSNIGDSFRLMGRFHEASEYINKTLSLSRNLYGASHPEVAYSLKVLAALEIDQGNPELGEKTARDAIAMLEKTTSGTDSYFASTYLTLGDALLRRGKPSEAEAFFRKGNAVSIEHFRAVNPDHFSIPYSEGMIGLALFAQGKAEEAGRLLRMADEQLRKHWKVSDPRFKEIAAVWMECQSKVNPNGPAIVP